MNFFRARLRSEKSRNNGKSGHPQSAHVFVRASVFCRMAKSQDSSRSIDRKASSSSAKLARSRKLMDGSILSNRFKRPFRPNTLTASAKRFISSASSGASVGLMFSSQVDLFQSNTSFMPATIRSRASSSGDPAYRRDHWLRAWPSMPFLAATNVRRHLPADPVKPSNPRR